MGCSLFLLHCPHLLAVTYIDISRREALAFLEAGLFVCVAGRGDLGENECLGFCGGHNVKDRDVAMRAESRQYCHPKDVICVWIPEGEARCEDDLPFHCRRVVFLASRIFGRARTCLHCHADNVAMLRDSGGRRVVAE